MNGKTRPLQKNSVKLSEITQECLLSRPQGENIKVFANSVSSCLEILSFNSVKWLVKGLLVLLERASISGKIYEKFMAVAGVTHPKHLVRLWCSPRR